jgi:hypothetical protein
MTDEWDFLIRDLAILNGDGNKKQEYKDLCASTALTTLWSIVENDMRPTPQHLRKLRDLIEEYETGYYHQVIKPKMEAEKKHLIEMEQDNLALKQRILKLEALLGKCKCGLYQTCDICKKYQQR